MITRYATSEHNTDNRDQLMDLFNSDVELLRVSWIILSMDNYKAQISDCESYDKSILQHVNAFIHCYIGPAVSRVPAYLLSKNSIFVHGYEGWNVMY